MFAYPEPSIQALGLLNKLEFWGREPRPGQKVATCCARDPG